MRVVNFGDGKTYYFKDLTIIKNTNFNYYWFFIFKENMRHVDQRKFKSYDMCFRAARKWIRDNQNLVYGHE